MCFAIGIVVVPWYVRNTLVLGSGAGLGTSGGVFFFQAHRPDGPGYRDLKGTPLESLKEIELSREGYRLGIKYIWSEPLSLVKGAFLNTVGLYAPSTDGLEWSTRIPKGEGESWRNKPLALLSKARTVTVAYYGLLLSMACLSLLTTRDWPWRGVYLLGSLFFAHWLLYAVVGWGWGRYRFFPEVLFCICGGVVITKLASRYPTGMFSEEDEKDTVGGGKDANDWLDSKKQEACV
jgi:hypothetical protein